MAGVAGRRPDRRSRTSRKCRGASALSLTIGIDASRNRSGGALAHLTGVLSAADPSAAGISTVHVWAPAALRGLLPHRPWLHVHHPPALSRHLGAQLWWQATALEDEARRAGCDLLWATDAATVCRFRPLVVLSQDLLSYEPGVAALYGWGRERWRLEALRVVQNAAFRRAAHVLFLTAYAARLVQEQTGPLSAVSIVPHGVDTAFFAAPRRPWPTESGATIRVGYVSNAAPYKHQWVVVEAIGRLRAAGLPVALTLVGGGHGPAQRRTAEAITRWDPDRRYVRDLGAVPAAALPGHLGDLDVFVFASSCENLPVTLLEAMAAGLPIACARAGPMPDILQDAGVYCDPRDAASVAAAITTLLHDEARRVSAAARARTLAAAYSWRRCADETFACLARAARPLSP